MQLIELLKPMYSKICKAQAPDEAGKRGTGVSHEDVHPKGQALHGSSAARRVVAFLAGPNATEGSLSRFAQIA